MEKKLTTYLSMMLIVMCGMSFAFPVQAERLCGQLEVVEEDITSSGASFTVGCSPFGVSETGACWATSPAPSLENGADCMNELEGFGTLSGIITALAPSTTYYICVYAKNIDGDIFYTCEDEDGETVTFTTLAGAANNSPTDITLDNTAIGKNLPSGTEVGTFATTDADAEDTHVYTLESGDGDTDNDSFVIEDNILKTGDSLAGGDYSIRVQTNDNKADGTFQKSFSISVSQPGPSVSFSPADGATGVSADTEITITFGEAVRLTDDSEITDSNVDALITLKKDNAEGEDIAFDASINTEKTLITIVPAANPDYEQICYAAIGATVEGGTDNPISATSATFTTEAAPAGPVLSVSPDTKTATAASGSFQAIVQNTGTGTLNWTASETSDWLNLSGSTSDTGDGLFTVNYETNTGPERKASVTITASGASGSPETISITQTESPDVPVLSVTPSSQQDVSAGTGTIEFTVANAGAGTLIWEALTGDDWLSVAGDDSGTGDGAFTVQYEVNPGGARIGTVIVSADGASGSPKFIAISQDVASGDVPILSVEDDFEDVSASGGTVTFFVSNKGTGTLSWDASTADTWLDITPDTENGLITVDYDGNPDIIPRVGEIEITASGASGSPKTVEVRQAAGTGAYVLSVLPASHTFFKEGGSRGFDVTNTGPGDMSWSAETGGESWLNIDSGNSGTNTGQVVVTCQANDGDERSAFVTVRATDAENSPVNVIVEQDGADTPDNQAPTDISLSSSAIVEKQPAGTHVGTLSATDPDSTDTHIFDLAPGQGSMDNTAFSIADTSLKTTRVFDYDVQNIYHIRISADDTRGGVFEKQLTVTVIAEGSGNHDPTAINLSQKNVPENQPSGTEVGTFESEDPDSGDNHTYTIVAGDQSSFSVSGNTLKTDRIFDFETKDTYSIRVKSDDGNGGTLEKVFSISVSDVNDVPSDISLYNTEVTEYMSIGTEVTNISTTDQDSADSHSYDLTGGADSSAFAIDGVTLITNTIFDYDRQDSYTIRIRSTDSGGESYEKDFVITVSGEPDTTPPDVTFSPADGTEDVSVVNPNISVSFSEPVRLSGNEAITNSNVAELITFRKNSASEPAEEAFEGTINIGKTRIVIRPEEQLEYNQTYYVAIAPGVEDNADNPIHSGQISATFRTMAIFEDISADMTGVGRSAAVWGDYDSNGYVDILVTGYDYELTRSLSEIWEYDGTDFSVANDSLTGIYFGSVAHADYDKDGDPDILVTGHDNSRSIARVWQNSNGNFTDIGAGLIGVHHSAGVWGDYDRDGDPDIFLTGYSDEAEAPVSMIYRNDNGVFTDIEADIPGVNYAAAAWGDYDRDGYPDILLTGNDEIGRKKAVIWRNEKGTGVFADAGADNLTGVSSGDLAWGDYDNDGDSDILLTGNDGVNKVSIVYRNDGNGMFRDAGANLPGVYQSSADWGDYDNDGDLDILLTGDDGTGNRIAEIYQNEGDGVFTPLRAGLIGVSNGQAAWGDYDNDGRPDIFLTGESSGSGRVSKVYRNNLDTGPLPDTTLKDVITILRVMAGLRGVIHVDDTSGNGSIGLEEAAYLLRKLAGMF